MWIRSKSWWRDIEQGTHGLAPVGTTGESPTLTHEEHEMVVTETVKAAAGRVPVVAGAGSNNTVDPAQYETRQSGRCRCCSL